MACRCCLVGMWLFALVGCGGTAPTPPGDRTPSPTTPSRGVLPVFDMHLHAKRAPSADRDKPPTLCLPISQHDLLDPKCPDPIVAVSTDEALIAKTVEILERRNVYGVISGGSLETVDRYVQAAPARLLPAYQFGVAGDDVLSVSELRPLFESGALRVLGEIENQYQGVLPDDERMEPYWAMAEELGIPVAIHMGEGYPGAPFLGDPAYRVANGNPLLLEEVLVKHPKLRVYVMHFGSPLVEEMIGIMQTYPDVYIDVGGNTWPYPRAYFYSQLRQFIDAGFEKRILFGSDQMYWPELIEISIDIIEEAPFLSAEQKRDILYNNAARFLRLSEDEIARHHENAGAAR